MTNPQTARNWLMASAFDERAVEQHFVAVSANQQAVQAFGIPYVLLLQTGPQQRLFI